MATVTFISTPDDLSALLTQIYGQPTTPPSLYLDLEGTTLSRYGTVDLITMYLLPIDAVFLIDVETLQSQTFTTAASGSQQSLLLTSSVHGEPTTLKTILESCTIPKVLFDVRNDSDALFAHYGIRLKCVHDLQLMELATTTRRSRQYLAGLASCVRHNLSLTYAEFEEWQRVKTTIPARYGTSEGRSREIFKERPLQADVQAYCVQDVVHMPALWRVYNAKWQMRDGFWRWFVEAATKRRIKDSQSEGYVPNGEHKKLGWTWAEIDRARTRWRRNT